MHQKALSVYIRPLILLFLPTIYPVTIQNSLFHISCPTSYFTFTCSNNFSKIFFVLEFPWVLKSWPAPLTSPYSESKDGQWKHSRILHLIPYLWLKQYKQILCKTSWLLQELYGNLVINDFEACNQLLSICTILFFIQFFQY